MTDDEYLKRARALAYEINKASFFQRKGSTVHILAKALKEAESRGLERAATLAKFEQEGKTFANFLSTQAKELRGEG